MHNGRGTHLTDGGRSGARAGWCSRQFAAARSCCERAAEGMMLDARDGRADHTRARHSRPRSCCFPAKESSDGGLCTAGCCRGRSRLLGFGVGVFRLGVGPFAVWCTAHCAYLCRGSLGEGRAAYAPFCARQVRGAHARIRQGRRGDWRLGSVCCLPTVVDPSLLVGRYCGREPRRLRQRGAAAFPCLMTRVRVQLRRVRPLRSRVGRISSLPCGETQWNHSG